MAVDLTGPMLVCHAALPALKQAGRPASISPPAPRCGPLEQADGLLRRRRRGS